jgi:hypothetical protein
MERELTDAECDAIVSQATPGIFPAGRLIAMTRAYIRAGWQAAIAAQPAQELIADANRYHWLCDHPDWSFIESLCQSFIANTASEFYRALNAEIDRRRADVARRGPLEAQLDGWEAAAQPAQERDARAYAIEHGGYLADAALHLLGKTTDLHVSIIEEMHEAPDDVREAFSEAYSALENAIYEFRKRAKRAAAQPERAREPVAVLTGGEFDRMMQYHAQKQPQPVAWAHNKDGRVDVIHDRVKQLWIDSGAPQQVEYYTIPLYAAPIATLPDGDTR